MTFVPGYMTKFLEKSKSFQSDALILDLEDSVPLKDKATARKNIIQYLDNKSFSQQIYIRVNPIESGMLFDDLSAAIHEETDGIMFTKVRDEKDIIYFDKLLTQLEIALTTKIDAIDTPFLDTYNLEGFEKEVKLARELGFSGTLIIHPSQIEIANKAFTPSEQEISEAKKIIRAIEESKKKGLGIALLDGKLIGPPMEKRALNVMSKIIRIKASENEKL